MTEKFLRAVSDFNMCSEGEAVTVALSGGADSMALLHLFLKNRELLGINLRAAHLNHNLRGEESFSDEQFVRNICKQWDIPLTVESADINRLAIESGESIELAARRARYDFFSRLNCKVATAHTASDNAETVIFNLARGSALKGASGIPAVRGDIIRPLRLCTRAEVEEYCAQNKVPFVTDSTNLTDDYSRNKIRHNVIPVLRELNSSVEDAFLRFSASAQSDCDFIDSVAGEYFLKNYRNGTIELSRELHPAVGTRVVSRLIKEVTGKGADSAHISAVMAAFGKANELSLSGKYKILVDGRRLSVVPIDYTVPARIFSVSMRTVPRENYEKERKINKLLLKNAIDCDKISGAVLIRGRESGDSIKLCGRGTKSLKKLYNEEAVPLCERRNLPVAADDCGPVWVFGMGAAERVKICGETENVMIFDVK